MKKTFLPCSAGLIYPLLLALVLFSGKIIAQNQPLPAVNSPEPQNITITDTAKERKEYVYVNTDNLILRGTPVNDYTVMGIISAPSKLEVTTPVDETNKNKKYMTKFYHVEITVAVPGTYGVVYGGYVDKNYVVKDPNLLAPRYKNKSTDPVVERGSTIAYAGPSSGFPDVNNRFRYLYPLYKGGDPSITNKKSTPKNTPKVYQKGMNGGCFYYNSAGLKIYVDRSLCK